MNSITDESLPIFRSIMKCSKCGCTTRGAEKYISPFVCRILYGATSVAKEHMAITCEHCGYSWRERCGDASKLTESADNIRIRRCPHFHKESGEWRPPMPESGYNKALRKRVDRIENELGRLDVKRLPPGGHRSWLMPDDGDFYDLEKEGGTAAGSTTPIT